MERKTIVEGQIIRRRAACAFSLIEMLAVMVIVGALIAMVLPAFHAINGGSALTRSGDSLVAQVDVARQTAAAHNRAVEIRFYKYVDPNQVGTSAYQGFQLFEVFSVTRKRAIGPMVKLQPNIIFIEDTDLSSLMTLAAMTGYPLSNTDCTSYPLPGVGSTYSGFGFRVRPNGTTDLPNPSTPYFLTLAPSTAKFQPKVGSEEPVPPANYYTVQVDPQNSTVRSYRP